ncbi:MAG: AtpZ/AtpI family protein [Patescibacteria group bacterium]
MKDQRIGDNGPKAWWQPALAVFAKMSGWIFFPILAGIFFGKWLDKKFGTDPWLFLCVLGVTFVISIAGIAKISLEEYKRIEEEEKEKKNGKENGK